MPSRKRRAKKKRRRIILSGAVLLALALTLWSLWGNSAPVRTDVSFASPRLPAEFDGYVIAQVSDLHDAELGKDNARIIDIVKDAEPDIIVLTGDFVDSNRTDIDLSLRTAQALAEIAPVYYINGNHEAALSWDDYHALTRGLKACGVSVLEDLGVTLVKNGAEIKLIGVNDLGFIPGGLSKKEAALSETLSSLVESDKYTLLLSHRGDLFDIYTASGADLVLSGHEHGGQIRLPFIGGLYAPGQGLFPKYDAGMYESGTTSMYISRGIGNSTFPVRINNRPEVVIVTLRRE